MSSSTVEVYEKLKSTVGEDGAKILIDYVDSKIEKTAVTKLDLTNVENSLRADVKEIENNLHTEMKGIESSLRAEMKGIENNLRVEIKELDHRMRLYFLGVAALIILTNPKILDLVGRLLGVIK